MSMRPSMSALLRAQAFDNLDAARNGGQGQRDRMRTTLRLPPDLWDRVKIAAEHFALAFPERYVTTTSTVEFLLSEALGSIAEVPRVATEPNHYVLCPLCQDSHHEDDEHECQ
jgi:hypothetical protein